MYAIIRAKKLKSFGAISRSARHTFREQPTPNANPASEKSNRTVGALGSLDVVNKINARLPEKRRRDAVLCIEYLITASPEAFARHGGTLSDLGSGYFRDALNWLRIRHGADNVISATIHLDETTPHLVAYVVPLSSKNNLCARDFLGGPKVLRDMQNDFYAVCGSPHGLLRGIVGSKAKHEDVASFYAAITAAGHTSKLSRIDYTAKLLGYETEAWKMAESLAKDNAIKSSLELRRKKAGQSRYQALACMESDNFKKSTSLERRNEELGSRENILKVRERDVAERENEISRRQPELQLALAQVEVMRRIIDHHGLMNPKPIHQSLLGIKTDDLELSFR